MTTRKSRAAILLAPPLPLLACSPESPDAEDGGIAPAGLIVGGQNFFVTLASSSVCYETGCAGGGEGGCGSITVANEDGTLLFTGSSQPFFQYGGEPIGGAAGDELGPDGLLSENETSQARTWRWSVPRTVDWTSSDGSTAAPTRGRTDPEPADGDLRRRSVRPNLLRHQHSR